MTEKEFDQRKAAVEQYERHRASRDYLQKQLDRLDSHVLSGQHRERIALVFIGSTGGVDVPEYLQSALAIAYRDMLMLKIADLNRAMLEVP